MIKAQLGEVIVDGNVLTLAMEFEDIARGVKKVFCNALGEKVGNLLWEKCVNEARKSDEERKREVEEEIRGFRETETEKAKLADALTEFVLKEIAKGR